MSAKTGGEFLVRAQWSVLLKGEKPDVVVIQRFPDLAAVQPFCDNPSHREAQRLAKRPFTRDVAIEKDVSGA